MKDIKSYIIGFLSCACLFLIMGQTESDNQNGRYQAFAGKEDIYYLVDTTNGELHIPRDHFEDMNPLKEKKVGWVQIIPPNKMFRLF